MSGNEGEIIRVPPGFRFHPTDEELLYYYLRKKVSYEPIDLDVIPEVDLNKLEPWDLKDKCRIGSGPHNEWYFFSHKDKKYPTGTRTNRATTAGFWKATGRDKAIHHTNSKRIGMRKTLVFYTGRAPHGQKTDWIMHEYRLNDDHNNSTSHQIQEEGWVVCRVFRKKNHTTNINIRGFQQEIIVDDDEDHQAAAPLPLMELHHHHQYNPYTCMEHLPQLFSPESAVAPPSAHHMMDLLSFTSPTNALQQQRHHVDRFNGDWSFLDKLLTSGAQPQTQDQAGPSTQSNKFPFQYLGCDTDVLNFTK